MVESYYQGKHDVLGEKTRLIADLSATNRT